MRMTRSLWAALLMIAVMSVSHCTFSDEDDSKMSTTLMVGAAAPPFSLPGSDGKTYSLQDFIGKKAVVIAWFPKAFTGG